MGVIGKPLRGTSTLPYRYKSPLYTYRAFGNMEMVKHQERGQVAKAHRPN